MSVSTCPLLIKKLQLTLYVNLVFSDLTELLVLEVFKNTFLGTFYVDKHVICTYSYFFHSNLHSFCFLFMNYYTGWNFQSYCVE